MTTLSLITLPLRDQPSAISLVRSDGSAFLSSSRVFPLFSDSARNRFQSRISLPGNGSSTRSVKICVAKGKGFGELVKKSKQEAEGHVSPPKACPCGGGENRKEYSTCCARFHGGVIEPDALILMKARFSAYALGVIPYIVRTTHPGNPDFYGADKLAEDVRATCERLRFVKLHILDHERSSESEEYVSFVAHYTFLKGGRGGERKQLKEKSHFVKEDDRWLYHGTVSISKASEAAWKVSTAPNFVKTDIARKSFSKSKLPQTRVTPRGF